MKTSRAWLQKFFHEELPSSEVIADALTFHAAEIEEVKGDLIDVNVLPDRASYLLSHRGVAKEIAAALNLSLANDPLRKELQARPATDRLSVTLDAEGRCVRYLGALVTGVKVEASPLWLKEALESVGQRSINNVVDATNYVMLTMGQPLHAFDAQKLVAREGVYAIQVRASEEGEQITTLTGETYTLPEGALVITDAHAEGAPLGIAGIKGGNAAAITEATTDIILEAANFDGTLVRKTAQAIKLFTDASSRFQNKPSPALAAYGMDEVIDLILQIAGGELVGVVDVYPRPPEAQTVSVSLNRINSLLGSSFTPDEVRAAFDTLGFSYTEIEDGFAVLVPFERNDLQIPEDLVEEIGRTVGYDRITPVVLPVTASVPDQARFRGIERIKDFLVERGFTELSTPSFASEGEILLANPLQSDKPFMRASLLGNLEEARTRAHTVAPRVLGPEPLLKLFEVGSVFKKEGEQLVLAMGVTALSGKQQRAVDTLKEHVATLEQEIFETPVKAHYSLDGSLVEIAIDALNLEKMGENYAPRTVTLARYTPYSLYPFAIRDIAVWTPSETEESEVLSHIVKEAGEYLARIDLFDRFEKEGRISFAFRLIFESQDRTLSDQDLDPAMTRITDALNARAGWEVR